ncbi:hypothetical protein ZIOFF_044424 [Zingiber officinale]|uniref:Uncharacterized protein n=1 Tax=Zingiber officinale TaxID=94328 RepID=A0A8J5KX97_ZINOF|nr:hypothetical protein ZIOFF_044424 [Zingiber officinale]
MHPIQFHFSIAFSRKTLLRFAIGFGLRNDVPVWQNCRKKKKKHSDLFGFGMGAKGCNRRLQLGEGGFSLVFKLSSMMTRFHTLAQRLLVQLVIWHWRYALRGHLTEKADVFAFGVLALVVVSRRPNSDRVDYETVFLLEWAWNLLENNQKMEAVDRSLISFDEEEVNRSDLAFHFGALAMRKPEFCLLNRLATVGSMRNGELHHHRRKSGKKRARSSATDWEEGG